MEFFIAIAHIIGAVFVVIIFGFVTFGIQDWENRRSRKRFAEEMSVALGVRFEDLDYEQWEKLAPKVLQLTSQRFSRELLRNRLSDFFGVIRTLWGWLSNIAQVIVLILVIWFSISENIEYAIYAWLIVGISFVFWIISVLFSLLCILLTGRYPGQAKIARRGQAEWVKSHGKPLSAKLYE